MEWAPDIQESGAYFCACGDNTAETGAGQGIDLLDCEGGGCCRVFGTVPCKCVSS